MKFYGAEFEMKGKTPELREEIEHRSGTHQVPVLQTPENRMIADTTPLMTMLDGHFPRRRLFPPGPLGVLVHVVEEYFDEWIARMHTPQTRVRALLALADNAPPEARERFRFSGRPGGFLIPIAALLGSDASV